MVHHLLYRPSTAWSRLADQNKNYKGVIEWNSDGSSFILSNHRSLRIIIKQTFKATHVSSFKRQLKNYGFKKESFSENLTKYSHPMFQKGVYGNTLDWDKNASTPIDLVHEKTELIVCMEHKNLLEKVQNLEKAAAALEVHIGQCTKANKELTIEVIGRRLSLEKQCRQIMFLTFTRWLLQDKMCDIIIEELVRIELFKADSEYGFRDYMTDPDSQRKLAQLLAKVMILNTDSALNKRLVSFLNQSLYDFCYEIKTHANKQKLERYFSLQNQSPRQGEFDSSFVLSQLERDIDYWFDKLGIKSLPSDIAAFFYKNYVEENTIAASKTDFDLTSLADHFSIKSLRDLLVLSNGSQLNNEKFPWE